MLYVHIGTTNDAKTHAIRSMFEAYRTSLLKALGVNLSGTAGRIEYVEHAVASGVGENPRDFDQTILGALNRATGALPLATPETKGAVVGVGIESGFVRFPRAGNAVFNFDVCCIKIGELAVYGFSQGTEYPRIPVERILCGEASFTTAMEQHLGTSPPSARVGFLGILTDFEYPRQVVSAVAVEHAVLRLIHKDDYYR